MRIFFLSIVTLLQINIMAQTGTPPAKPKPGIKPSVVAKTKIPKITASIGNMLGGTYDVAVAKNLIDNSLLLKDESGKLYKINRCSFLYKRKMVYTDEDTKEKRITYEYLSKELRNNEQLDEFWKKIIKEELKKGEELIFEKILADSGSGYMLQVKGLTIVVQ
jgi:hypothetical protein